MTWYSLIQKSHPFLIKSDARKGKRTSKNTNNDLKGTLGEHKRTLRDK